VAQQLTRPDPGPVGHPARFWPGGDLHPFGASAASAAPGLSACLALRNGPAPGSPFAPFTDSDPAVITALIGVHVTAPTRLTRAALPPMIERGRGAVINIASLLAFSGSIPPRPLPFRPTYAAATAYLTTFTCALAGELGETAVGPSVLPRCGRL